MIKNVNKHEYTEKDVRQREKITLLSKEVTDLKKAQTKDSPNFQAKKDG